MPVLFWSHGAASLAPHICLEEAGIAYEERLVDMAKGAHKEAAYLKINPTGKIPAFITDEGAVLTEAAAICLHIADAHPNARLLPSLGGSARSQAYMWLMHLTNTLQPASLRYYYPDRFTTDPNGARGILASAQAEIEQIWARMDAHLAKNGPFLLGPVFSAADIFAFMLSRWQECCPGLYDRFPAVKRLADAVGAREAARRVLALNEPA